MKLKVFFLNSNLGWELLKVCDRLIENIVDAQIEADHASQVISKRKREEEEALETQSSKAISGGE